MTSAKPAAEGLGRRRQAGKDNGGSSSWTLQSEVEWKVKERESERDAKADDPWGHSLRQRLEETCRVQWCVLPTLAEHLLGCP